MIVSQLYGGLGNQLFQYAAGKACSLRLNTRHALDLREIFLNPERPYYLDYFTISAQKKAPRIPSLFQKRISDGLRRRSLLLANIFDLFFKMRGYHLIEAPPNTECLEEFSLMSSHKDYYLIGYFQHEKFFNTYRSEICRDFTIKKELLNDNDIILLEHITSSPLPISIHIRQGDFKTLDDFFILGQEYYATAISYIESLYANPRYFVFSDDIHAAKNIIAPLSSHHISYCDNKIYNPPVSLWAMSQCHHNIIANSTFSWWAAWLNSNIQKTVVAPNIWNKQTSAESILPPSWITLPSYKDLIYSQNFSTLSS